MGKARDSIGYLTYKTSRVLTNHLTSMFLEQDVDITVEQWRVLLPLHKFDGLPQGVIGEVLMQEKTGISRLAAGLERHGYIRRETDREDRRLKRLFITEKGRDIIRRTLPLANTLQDDATSGIAPEDYATAKDVMHRILENLLGHPDPAVACCNAQDS